MAHWAQVSREHTPNTWLVAASCEFTTMWAWFRLFHPRYHLTLCTLKLMCHLSASFLFWEISFCLLYNFSTQPLLHIRNMLDAISIRSPQKPLVWYFVLMLPEDPHHLYLQPYSVTLRKSWWALDVAKLWRCTQTQREPAPKVLTHNMDRQILLWIKNSEVKRTDKHFTPSMGSPYTPNLFWNLLLSFFCHHPLLLLRHSKSSSACWRVSSMSITGFMCSSLYYKIQLM